jgi:uncharacterized protein (DUF2336 family)
MPHPSFADDLADLPRSTAETRDTSLIRATTDLYVQDGMHDREAIRRYEALATHFLPKISAADRAYVAERLADRADAPASVIRMLARDVIDVAAPVLASSPVVDTLTLLATIAVTGPEHHRVVARRKDLSDQVKRALRLTGDRDVLSVMDGAKSDALASPSVADAGEQRPPAGVEPHRDGWRFLALPRRERLAILVDYATRPAAAQRGGSTNRLDRAFRSILGAAKIVGFARAGQRSQLIAAIAEGLDLAPDFVKACVEDATGEATAILLKALRLDSAQAQQVFLLATPTGRDAKAFFPLADLYAGIEAGIAEAIVDAWRAQAAGQKPAYVPFVAGEDRARSAPQHEVRPAAQLRRQDEAKRA